VAVGDMARLRVDEAELAGGINIDDGLKVGVTPIGRPETSRAMVAE